MQRPRPKPDWILVGTGLAMACIMLLDYRFDLFPPDEQHGRLKYLIVIVAISIVAWRVGVNTYRNKQRAIESHRKDR